jgi:surface carbohydrate biosynthesis protein (TIGR04326 family)
VVVQHASYSHEKTFLFLHPSLEYKGEPDGFAVPHPDYVCVMGTLGQELFLECGYPRERVLLTGSPRYDHVTDRCSGKHTRSARGNEKLHLLMVSTLHLDLELEMIEAVCNAARDVNGFKLLFRNHPFRRIQQHPRFAEFKDQIQVMQGLLEEDLNRADLVLFTYSTVAEEAFLLGKPVWQWLPLGFNGSALAEAVSIPQFRSVGSLREALRDFQADPCSFFPGAEIRKLALQRLFFLGDGMSGARIAGVVGGLLAKGAGDGSDSRSLW